MDKKCLILFVAILYSFKLIGQVCTGSLGDPTVQINFGTGAGIGPPLTGVNTTYQFKNGDCPDDGFYAILNQTNSCFGNTWHSLTQDHTEGDVNGYMMMVNATNNPGVFYSFAVDNLCPNTNYEFSSFIINMIKPTANCGSITKPNITFSVETSNGTVIKSYSTGAINDTSNPEWKKYGFFFETPVGVSGVVLKMINNAGGGCGNDLAIDDITFRPCGPTILAGDANGLSNNSFKICEGFDKTFKLSADVSTGFDDPAYQWQINLNNSSGWTDLLNATSLNFDAEILNADLKGYQYRLAVAEKENINSLNCRVVSEAIEIITVPKIIMSAGNDLFVLENQAALLNATAPQGLQYQWSPSIYLSNSNVLNPTVTPLQTTTYTLTVTDLLTGCISKDEITVSVEILVKIPNTFSPNDDGINDLWDISTLIENKNVVIEVFNRDGAIVYKSKGYIKAWDAKINGKNLPIGMYYYIIDTKATTNNLYTGSILIVR
jgi:gliding motility-associated-like protein